MNAYCVTVRSSREWRLVRAENPGAACAEMGRLPAACSVRLLTNDDVRALRGARHGGPQGAVEQGVLL